uniref:Zgc:162324 n=1 Tax=Steinernema glaseri TaxID=37863 RepID=A0A1I8A9D7_9BILA
LEVHSVMENCWMTNLNLKSFSNFSKPILEHPVDPDPGFSTEEAIFICLHKQCSMSSASRDTSYTQGGRKRPELLRVNQVEHGEGGALWFLEDTEAQWVASVEEGRKRTFSQVRSEARSSESELRSQGDSAADQQEQQHWT